MRRRKRSAHAQDLSHTARMRLPLHSRVRSEPTSRTLTVPAGDRAVAVRLFGRHEIAVDGEPFRLATPRKTLQTLAYLLLNRGGAVSREYLAFLQWPDDEEEAARAKLRTTISDLLKVLPQPASDFVIVESDSLAWNPAARVWL